MTSTLKPPLKQGKNRGILDDWNPIGKFSMKPFGIKDLVPMNSMKWLVSEEFWRNITKVLNLMENFLCYSLSLIEF
jgi:hypothetical protein